MTAKQLGLDYFKIYEVASQRVQYNVQLQGQFDKEPDMVELLVFATFANVASKNKEPIVDKNAHLAYYTLHQRVAEPTRNVVAENQFGKQDFRIGNPVGLFAPARKYEPGLEFPSKLDHFKVYRILEGKPIMKQIALSDQFGAGDVTAAAPILFGVPVKKTHNGQTFPIHNAKAHLLIYNIEPRPLEKAVVMADQFGRRQLHFVRSRAVAAPTVKLEVKEI